MKHLLPAPMCREVSFPTRNSGAAITLTHGGALAPYDPETAGGELSMFEFLRIASRIRRRDALFGRVAEFSADAILVVGTGGHIEMANAAAASMFGCRREEMVGALVSRYVPLPDAAMVPATL